MTEPKASESEDTCTRSWAPPAGESLEAPRAMGGLPVSGSKTSEARGIDRRRVLTVGGASAVAAAVLAACGPSSTRSGESGTTLPPDATTTAPTVPPRAPTDIDIGSDTQQAKTLTSIELSAVKSYDTVISHLTDSANLEAAQAFRKQHEETAKGLQDATRSSLGDKAVYDKSNEYLDKQVSGPVLSGLESSAKNAEGDEEAQASAEDAFVRFLMNTEATLAATYLSAIGTVVTKELRDSISDYAAPSARRQAVWGSLAGSTVPSDAVYSVRDTVPNDALITTPGEKTSAE